MKIRSDFLNTPPAAQFAGNSAANTMSNFASLLQQESRAPALAPAAPPTVAAAPPKAARPASETGNAHRNAATGSSEPTDAADEASVEESANKPRAA